MSQAPVLRAIVAVTETMLKVIIAPTEKCWKLLLWSLTPKLKVIIVDTNAGGYYNI